MTTMPAKIRFAPVKCSPSNIRPREKSLPGPKDVGARSRTKTRSGCRECKARRVKCDETFPVCLRCQRFGDVCQSLPRKTQWQMEIPGITIPGASPPWQMSSGLMSMSHINKKLLHGWFDNTSRIMVLDTTSNPLSLPLLDYLSTSASLVHVLQSISAGHNEFFQQAKLEVSLQERNMALRTLRAELGTGRASMLSCFLTGYLLGTSSSFLDEKVWDYGKEHLYAARQMLEMLISDAIFRDNQMTDFCIGAFVYWDMTCAVLIDPTDQKYLDDTVIYERLSSMGKGQHPITGPCGEMFHLLGHLGRHCRAVVETGFRNVLLEKHFAQQLQEWDVPSCKEEFWQITAEAYRNYGLIMLYRTCGRSEEGVSAAEDELLIAQKTTEPLIRTLALETLQGLYQIPITSHFLVLQATPLMSAGAELTKEDEFWRKEVVQRFKALFSSNRLPASLWAIALLQELWELRDLDITMSWLELMLAKNWRLRLG